MEETKKLNFLEEIIEEDLRTGKVDSIMTRFPPEPNGYLHLGHAKSLCINFGLAEKYGYSQAQISRLRIKFRKEFRDFLNRIDRGGD